MLLILVFPGGAGASGIASSALDPAEWGGSTLYQSASGERYVLKEYVVETNLIRLDLLDPSRDLKGRVFVRLPNGDGWFLAVSSCSLGGKLDENLIAIAAYTEINPSLTQIAMAFLVDTEQERIVAIDPKYVTCINESYGV
jgi:hypothetical protein